MISGTAAVTFTRDRGRTLAPSVQQLSGVGYTYGLVALDVPDQLLAWHKQALIVSRDGGCNWSEVYRPETDPGFPPRLTAAKGGRAYGWSDNQRYLMRYDSRGPRALKAPGEMTGLGADPNNGEHVLAADAEGIIWRSRDGGESWQMSGRLDTVTRPVIFYRFTFDPSNVEHIVAGTTLDGAYVSRDGGATWQRATGLGTRASNTFNLVISPVNGNRVWAMSLDMLESDANLPHHGRHIYVSDDGGSSYRSVVDEAPGVKLINGPTMAADPQNADVLYFVFGTHTFGYGTDLFRYDASSRELTLTHNDHHDIDAIAFSTVDPSVMYLGLEVVQGH